MPKPHDDWERLAPAPRRISPMLAAQVLLGGARSQVGWFFFALGSFFFWICFWHADLSGWRFGPSNVAHTSGESTGCQNSGYTVFGAEAARSRVIYQNRYHYEVGGKAFEGAAYDADRCVHNGAVDVDYLRSQPEVSTISGMRREPLPAWVVCWVAMFPAMGLAVILSSLWRGRLRLRLLKIGLLAHGRLIQKARDGIDEEEAMVYAMTFEYRARDGIVKRTIVRTQFPQRLEDHPAEALLYDPDCPETAVLVDDLPGIVTLNESDQPKGASFEFVLLPAITVLIYFWLHRMAN